MDTNSRCDSLEELMAQSDAISLHCPLNDTTHHMINEHTMRYCKKEGGIFIINTSKGGLINEVISAFACNFHELSIRWTSLVQSKKESLKEQPWTSTKLNHLIHHYWVRVLLVLFRNEKISDPLRDLPQVIHTPNAAWFSEGTCRELRVHAAKEASSYSLFHSTRPVQCSNITMN